MRISIQILFVILLLGSHVQACDAPLETHETKLAGSWSYQSNGQNGNENITTILILEKDRSATVITNNNVQKYIRTTNFSKWSYYDEYLYISNNGSCFTKRHPGNKDNNYFGYNVWVSKRLNGGGKLMVDDHHSPKEFKKVQYRDISLP